MKEIIYFPFKELMFRSKEIWPANVCLSLPKYFLKSQNKLPITDGTGIYIYIFFTTYLEPWHKVVGFFRVHPSTFIPSYRIFIVVQNQLNQNFFVLEKPSNFNLPILIT